MPDSRWRAQIADQARAMPVRLRWSVDTTQWTPSPSELSFLLSHLPENERTESLRFKFIADQKRHLVSRLLGRAAAHAVLGLPHAQVQIKRTRGGKPYVANELPKPQAPNYNYSISHEGDYVVLASEPLAICGCDVAAPQQVRRRNNESLESFLRSFQDQFTAREWASIHALAPDEEAMEGQFRKLWSLKEAYIKAIGLGLEFELRKAEFTINGSTASIAVEGVSDPRWVFHLHELGKAHWVSVARGPLETVVDRWGGFRATWQKPAFTEEEWREVLAAPEPPFTMLTVADLLPESKRAAYADAGGEVL